MNLCEGPRLNRLVLTTSRLAEFCSEKELVNQTGHSTEEWPLVILKELVDNALDACEEAGVAPKIEIAIEDRGITISDNGPGIAPGTIKKIIDYTVRVSSREAYVSPTRGAQGNALKTLLAMPFALSDNEQGRSIIESQGVKHTITFSINPIRQEPRIGLHDESSNVKNGTRVTVEWPDSASSILDDARDDFLQKAHDYAWVNPHLTLNLAWNRDDPVRLDMAASAPEWRKWHPSRPTSPHWYNAERLGRLMGAYIAHDQDHPSEQPHTLRGFISEFSGLAGSAKARDICESIGATRESLAGFYGDGRNDRIETLLAKMQSASRPIKPRDLGVIGREHLFAKFTGCGVAPESFKYKCDSCVEDGVPYLIETAFGYCPELGARRLIVGLNWSIALGDPFRDLGSTGASLNALLTKQRAGPNEPIAVFAHVACPRLDYLDRGKSSVYL